MVFDLELIREVYARFPERVEAARRLLGKPLTLTEKILYAHLFDGNPSKAFARGKDYVDFAPDRAPESFSGIRAAVGECPPEAYPRRTPCPPGTRLGSPPCATLLSRPFASSRSR